MSRNLEWCFCNSSASALLCYLPGTPTNTFMQDQFLHEKKAEEKCNLIKFMNIFEKLWNYVSRYNPEICMHAKLLKLHSTLCDPMEPTRFLCLWDSPGKNTGVGCPALLQRDLPDPGIEPVSLLSPELADRFFTSAPWETQSRNVFMIKLGLCQ